MGLWNWSTTAANNATADPSINWQEGQAPSTVNDSARAMMAAIAVQFQTGWEWQEWGDTPTYVSGTQFTVPGNLTSRYTVGRRVRASVSAGTVYGTIANSVYSSLTTVTLALDSGALDSGLSEVDVGILNPAFPSLTSLPYLNVTGNSLKLGSGQNNEIDLVVTNANTTVQYFLNAVGLQGVYDIGRGLVRWSSDTSGNFSAAGAVSGSNLTATSDERLKKDWAPFESDFLDRVATVLHGTYTRIDTGERRVGVGAQSLREVIPEAVFGDETLTVSEGSAALAIVVELTREVLRLRALLEPVK